MRDMLLDAVLHLSISSATSLATGAQDTVRCSAKQLGEWKK